MPPHKAAEIAADNDITIHTVAVGDPSSVGEGAMDLEALAATVLFLGTGTTAAAQEEASAEARAQANNPLASAYALNFHNFYNPSLYGVPDRSPNTFWSHTVIEHCAEFKSGWGGAEGSYGTKVVLPLHTGDTHLHTSLSFDAGLFGATLTPENSTPQPLLRPRLQLAQRESTHRRPFHSAGQPLRGLPLEIT